MATARHISGGSNNKHHILQYQLEVSKQEAGGYLSSGANRLLNTVTCCKSKDKLRFVAVSANLEVKLDHHSSFFAIDVKSGSNSGS
jgi:hypothetical protein